MEEGDSDDSRASVITVESNASDDVIISGQEHLDNQNVNSPTQSEPQATTSSGQTNSGLASAEEEVSERNSQETQVTSTDAQPSLTNVPVSREHEGTNAETTFLSENFSHNSTSNLQDDVRPLLELEESERPLQNSSEDVQPGSNNASTTSSPLFTAIKEFIAGTAELTRLDCLTAESLIQRSSDPNIMEILKSLHKSLSSITGHSDSKDQKVSETLGGAAELLIKLK